jgi:MYXO-CTERM domain-containing protein
VVDPGFVVDSSRLELVDDWYCTIAPPPSSSSSSSSSSSGADDYDDCAGCQIAPGATRTAMILIAVLAAILPRRRRRAAR